VQPAVATLEADSEHPCMAGSALGAEGLLCDSALNRCTL
jgi:hypothetical protein